MSSSHAMQKSSLAAVDMPLGLLPIIDFAALLSDRIEDRKTAAQAVRTACRDKGFFYLANHGVPERLVGEMFRQAKAFFDLPLETKMELHMSKSWGRSNRGFSPIQEQRLEKDAPPDLKESFYIGVELPLDDPRVVAKKGNHGPNLWPHGLPDFRRIMQTYFAEMIRVELVLWRGPCPVARSRRGLFQGFLPRFHRDGEKSLFNSHISGRDIAGRQPAKLKD